MPAGLGTLFAGLLLIVLAFVEGSSVWKSLHEVLFGLFGCGSFVLGAAVCYLAILYTRGEDLLGQVFKLLLGLIFASGTVIVFSDIPADIPAARMVAECYQNGVTAWLGGGALGALLGGNLLLLDEPTNDIDVNTLRALEEGLENFAGCAVVVSHDRWFLDRICTHILSFEGDSNVVFYEGSYSEYEEYKRKLLGDVEPKRVRYRKLIVD